MAHHDEDGLFVSAKKRQGIEELRKKLYLKVRELHVQKYPYNDFLYDTYEDSNEE